MHFCYKDLSSVDSEVRLVVVIPTAFRNQLLRRTLQSLSECEIPKSLDEVVIVENGDKGDAERFCDELKGRLPIRYLHVEIANKSVALNTAFESLKGKLAIMFDDDVRFETGILMAFESAAKRRHEFPPKSFFAGLVLADYEDKPAEALHPYLPGSVMGWTLGNEEVVFDQPDALGANLAVFADDVLALSGFSTELGPGTASRGQESDMQSRLLNEGGKGVFLPDAVLWHYVPKERCTEEWALKRQLQMGVMQGLKRRDCNIAYKLKELVVRGAKLSVLSALKNIPGCPRKTLHWKFRINDHLGFLQGIFSGSA